MNFTKNFTRKELACPCCGECKMSEKLLTKLQAYRDILGFPLTVTSAYRCSAHNKEIGGSTHSQHLSGTAVDLRIGNKSSAHRYRMIKAAFDLDFKGIGIGKNHFHLDCRDERKSWGY